MELRSEATIVNAEHVMSEDGFGWCQPRTEDVLPFGQIVVHRHFMDRPEYSEGELGTLKGPGIC